MVGALRHFLVEVDRVLRRVVLTFAVSAAIVVGGGAAAWFAHLSSLNALLDAQAASATAFLTSESGARDPERLVTAIARPSIDVLLHDHYTGQHVAWVDGELVQGEGFMPPPGLPPLPIMLPRRAHGPAQVVAELAHVPPRHVRVGDVDVLMLPSAPALLHWLVADAVICAVLLVALGSAAWAIGAAVARVQKRPLIRTTLALEALAGGNFTPQAVEAGEAPEIARLARAYNAAAETVARSIEERQAAAAEYQRFLADAGHELRTPLTIVGGYVDILRNATAENDETGTRVLAGMTAEVARMRGLVEKMLLLSRMEAPVVQARVVDVGAVSEEVAESLRTGFPNRTIEVNCEPGARVSIDEDDLYEAERNLVENALRYAPESAVEVRAAVNGGAVAIEVSDRGPGIPPEAQAHVFERFYRGPESARFQGSGLGLAIVRRVVDRWGGTIALQSGETGTQFVMRFPLAHAESPA